MKTQWITFNGRSMVNMQQVMFIDEKADENALVLYFDGVTKKITFKSTEAMNDAFDKILNLMVEEPNGK